MLTLRVHLELFFSIKTQVTVENRYILKIITMPHMKHTYLIDF